MPPQGFVNEEFELHGLRLTKALRARLLRRLRLPAQILPLLIHARQAQRLGLGQAVEIDDFDVADGHPSDLPHHRARVGDMVEVASLPPKCHWTVRSRHCRYEHPAKLQSLI